jgi:nucleoside-diphosphate-sugar epimerase/EAL domain-containing protein (putative c-di-GMP-specific phosphodiesterase class I)
MARYLVTGVAGFIGSWIAQRLVSEGHQVRGLDNMSRGSAENLAAVGEGIDFRCGDIRNSYDVERACDGIDGIFHQAAIASVQDSMERPLETNEINYTGTLNLIEAAQARKVRRIVFASSSAIYGDQGRPVLWEGMHPDPVSPYGMQKLSCEHALRVAHLVSGIETISLRYFNVFGPRQSATSAYSGVIARFARQVTCKEFQEDPVIYGDGEQSRDFVYIEDVVEANLLAMFAPASVARGKAFNVGSGRSYTINAVAEHLGAISGKPLAPKHHAARVGEIRTSGADISAAVGGLGYVPKWTFQDGLEKTVAWYRDQTPRSDAGPAKPSIPLSPPTPRLPADNSPCNALRRAFEAKEFRLAYQPILDISSCRIVGAEALLRWQRGKELLTAGVFIEALEKCDLLDTVEEWVLREACAKAAWIQGRIQPNFRIAVNVAPQQWAHERLREVVASALKESGCEPALLDLEITERTALSDCPCVLSLMRDFRGQGITVTIDDFGTGHANFSCLQRFPINHLKIDRFYAKHANTRKKVLSGIIAAAHRQGITCTAEGVESSAQLDQLRTYGCDEAQGFYLGHPMPIEALIAFVQGGQSGSALLERRAS